MVSSLPQNERKQVDLRYHSSKVELVCLLFGRNVGLKKSFQVCLTFIYAPCKIRKAYYTVGQKRERGVKIDSNLNVHEVGGT